MSAAVVLPFVWAFAVERPMPLPPAQFGGAQPDRRPPEPQVAFYRKYTEALLRRYVRMSMEAGKVPSLLGAATMLGLPPRTAVRRYCRALDRLTTIFLRTRMLEPLKYCQEAGSAEIAATY